MVNRDGGFAMPSPAGQAGWGPQSMKRVLLVEDQESDAADVRQAFERFALDVQLEHVSSAELAWGLLKCWADAPSGRRPVCVLIGLTPGARDGVWLLEQMQPDRRFRDLPVMAFGREAGMSERARLYSNVVGALERPRDAVAWRRLISAVARLSQALPDLAGA